MHSLRVSLFALAVFAFLLTACGGGSRAAASAAQAVEVQITLNEFKITSSRTSFSVGVPYRFVIKNVGSIAHEWMIMPPGENNHMTAVVEVNEKDLQPGKTVTREITFTQAGKFEFACHSPGHYEVGMLLPITVN